MAVCIKIQVTLSCALVLTKESVCVCVCVCVCERERENMLHNPLHISYRKYLPMCGMTSGQLFQVFKTENAISTS
jgi:hypothetical protein